MHAVRFRLANPELHPRRTRLEMPGWGGAPQPRKDGSHQQVWHCMQFTEGAQYGFEVLYPYENELRVSNKDGQVLLEGDFGPAPDDDLMWPPFRPFGENYYTYQLLLDLDAGPGWAVRTEPHPRYFTDPTDTVPLAVPALVRTAWWPMISFVVFKAPPEGKVHVFRHGEPMLQFVIVPEEADFQLVEMTPEEAAQREVRSRRIHASRDTLGIDSRWVSSTNTVFDGTYRFLLRAAKSKARNS